MSSLSRFEIVLTDRVNETEFYYDIDDARWDFTLRQAFDDIMDVVRTEFGGGTILLREDT